MKEFMEFYVGRNFGIINFSFKTNSRAHKDRIFQLYRNNIFQECGEKISFH